MLTCPYCASQVEPDPQAINGIRPITGVGCEWCFPETESDELPPLVWKGKTIVRV